MRRSLSVCLTLGLVLMASSLPVAAKVSIIHFTYGGHGQAWYDYLVDRAKVFNEQNPDIEVSLVQASSTQYAPKFQVMLAGGTPPDVTDFNPTMGSSHIISGVFSDLRPYLAKDNVNLLKATSPSVMSVLTVNNSVWGLPADIFPVVTFYNEDIFDNAGLAYPKDLGDKWTWDAAFTVGRKTTIDKDADGKPEQLGFDQMWARWYIWVNQAGGTLYDRIVAPTKSNWNSPEVVQGLKFPLTVIQDGLGLKSNSPGVAQTYFWFGHDALSFVNGPGAVGAYLKNPAFRYDIAPQVRGPKHAGTEIVVDAFEMIDAAPHKAESWKWLKFISLDVDSHAKFVEMTGRAPSLAVLQRRYKQLCNYLPNNFMAFFDAAGAQGTQMNYLLTQTQISTVVNSTISKIFAGTLPVETGVQQLQDQVTALLESK